MASGVSLDFVPARRPEAVRMDVSKYKIIKPKPASVISTRSDSNLDSNEDSAEDDYDEQTRDTSHSESSMEDSEKSDTEDSSSNDDSSDENTSDDEEVMGTDKNKLPKQKSTIEKHNTQKQFYDINENPNDRGTRTPKRIYKSWHPAAKAPVGLINQGVTCYMNAAIQTIVHLPAVGRYLLEVLNGKHPKVSKNSVTYELAALLKKMMEKKSAVLPHRLLRRLEDINPMLDEWQQEDSHEYYMSLVSRLQEDSVPKGEKLRSSIMHDIFGGSVEQKVTCERCQTVSTTTQDFYDLPVSFSQKEHNHGYTLEQSIRDFFTPETITATEKGSGYQCEKCHRKTKATKQIAIAEAPEYLTVHVKRFKMDEGISKKVKEAMKYPLEMNLTQYETDETRRQPLKYKLIAVIVHEGRTVSSGHYIALTRQPNNNWMMYDDELTRQIPESYVESHSSAYILLYSRLLEKPTKLITKPSASKPDWGLASDVKEKKNKSKSKSKSKVKPVVEPKPKVKKLQNKQIKKMEFPKKSKKRVSAETIDEIFGKTKKSKTNHI